MSETANIPSNQELQNLSDNILSITELIDNLPTVARVDALPKIERLQVMEKALFRDLAEATGSEQGAGSATVVSLYDELRRETTSLKNEMSVIDQGNPTTISAIGDAAMEAVEAASSRVVEKVEEGVDAIREKFSSESK